MRGRPSGGRLKAAAGALLLLSAPADARANGRFPESNALFFAPSDPGYVLLRTTFGQLVTRDRGATWDWICERAVGLAGIEDPMFAVTPDDTVLASTFEGLAISRDRACNFGFAGGALGGLTFVDLAARAGADGGAVVALASSYDGVGDAGLSEFRSALFETTDQGRSFAALGPPLDRTVLGETVDLAPTDADRVYVSGVRRAGTLAEGVLLTSRDHGTTWEESPIELVSGERAAFLAAVDPVNADRVYVRTSNAVDLPSRLLVSDDAGRTFRTVFTSRSQLTGFALAKDGTKVWVGGMQDGLLVASTSDFAFTQRSTIEVSCLALGADGLWACSNEKSGFVAGLSRDEGATFEAKLHFCDVKGPLACAVGSTTHTECSLGGTSAGAAPPWPTQRALLGCSGPLGPDAGAPDAGASAATLDAGSGCRVRAPTPASAPFAALLSALAATVALVRRRRRRG
jgi:photosystem II stability/assembly factor-like uncharacterized protein